MNLREFWRPFLLLALSMWLVTACEQPRLKASRDPDPEPMVERTPVDPPVNQVSVDSQPDPAEPSPPPKSNGPGPKMVIPYDPVLEKREPELKVERLDDKIVLSGALKSRRQIERIEKELGEAFSGTRIENNIILDFNRLGVGWGNRVTDMFLIDYLKSVKDPVIRYSESVVTLKGTYKHPGDLMRIQKSAVVAFSGDFTREINNQMKLETDKLMIGE